MICTDIWQVKATLDAFRKASPEATIVFTSLPADPLHSGHLRLLRESAKMGVLVVSVNSDQWLERKKGYYFMTLAERMDMITDYANFTFPYDDQAEAIRLLRPHAFCKGGDRSDRGSILREEIIACEEVGCELRLGVGGSAKAQSSSALVERAVRALMSRDSGSGQPPPV